VWHDKDPSLLKSTERWAKVEILQPLASNSEVSI
jgi:hypothetical protein